MGVSPALTGTELTNLAGVTTLKRYLSPVPDVTVATALVNMTTFTYPLASLVVDTTSNWTSVAEGQTVYIGSAAGLKDRGVFRVRKAGNSTTLFIEEISSQSVGQLAIDIRTASIGNNDYITVIQRWDMWSVLPRIDATTGLITEDYDKTVGTNNTTPAPLTYITVNGRRNHLFTYIATASLGITASVTVTKWTTSSGSTLTYLWTYPAGWTGVSGSTTATLTATATPGNYILKCTVTDSIGGAVERVIVVNIHDATTNPPLLISEMPRSDTRDRGGRRMTFGLYSNRLTSLVDGAMCGYFEVCTWNSTDVDTATRQFVGWIQRHELATADTLRESTVELVGPAALLDKMQIVSQVITATASPTTWQQVVPSLSSASFMAWYMLRWRVANMLRLFNLTVFSVTATGQRLPKWQIDKGSALSQIRQLITDRGNFGANSEGEFFFLYHPSLIAYASRGSVVTRDSLNASIYKSLSVSRDLNPRVQQVRGEGFSWDGSATLPTPYYSDAPKSPGQGNTQTKLGSQVVTGQSELNQLTGDEYARVNNPYSQFTALIEKNRDVYEPAEMAFVSVTLPANLSATGAAITKNTIPLTVNKHHNPDGTSDIELIGEAETTGVIGDYVPVPPPNNDNFGNPITPTPVDLPPLPNYGDFSIPFPTNVFPTIPANGGPAVIPGKAGIRVDKSANKVYWSPDYTVATPTEYDVTPSGLTNITHATLSRGTPFSRKAYVLGNDGADSTIAYTTDIFQTTPTYTYGATVSELYTIIESVKDIPGALYILANGGGWTYPEDFTASNGGYTATYGSWSAAGWEGTTGGTGVSIVISKSVTSGTFTSLSITVACAGTCNISVTMNSGTITLINLLDVVSGTYTWTGSQSGVTDITLNPSSGTVQGNQVTLLSANWAGIGSNPFTGAASGATITRYSTDYGVTLGAVRTVDTVSGSPGFSVGPRGIAALAGGDERVRIALAGGTYANAVNGGASGSYPISVKVPEYKIGSTSATNKADDPDFLFASPAVISSHALWKVVLAGKIGITPLVSSVQAVGVSPFGLDTWRGKRIVYIGDAGGTRGIFTTRNTGSTWVYTTHATAVSVRPLRYSATGMQWLACCGTSGMLYSINGGVSWSTVTVSGSADYGELLG